MAISRVSLRGARVGGIALPLFRTATPSDDEVLEALRVLMRSEFGLEPDAVVPTAHLIDDLDLDSIDLVDLAVGLEQESGVKLEEDDIRPIRTVADAVSAICAAAARRHTGAA